MATEEPKQQTFKRVTDDPDYFNRWYRNNRDKVLKKLLTKVTCECSAVVCKAALPKHRTSERHKLRMIAKKVDELKNL